MTKLNHRRINKGLRCHYCGAAATTADHIVPKAKGGTSAQWNLVPACRPCNQAKDSAEAWCSCPFCEEAKYLFRLSRQKKSA